ncbi:hypothetical protein MM59RIKEN_12850 [Pusillibacter faecalis]|uniref:Uncharacterized protein n=1 Tax=Pusillibacter faecalis TaxID=2714358 RepID=A0A810QDM4_9FIRM|nr:hypothetical protein MM59RIKEN_12850 [Pusillibacter faecalis]
MKKYQQAMRRLELTEMHERILTHLCAPGARSRLPHALLFCWQASWRFPGCFPAIRQIPPTY